MNQKLKTFILIIIAILLTWFLVKSCNNRTNINPKQDTTKIIDSVNILKSKLIDLQDQKKVIEKNAYSLGLLLQSQIKATASAVEKIKSFTKQQRNDYFTKDFGTADICDSIPSTKIIEKLEIGKGCEIEKNILTNIVKTKDSIIINDKAQIFNLTDQNVNLYNAHEIQKQNFKNEQNKTFFLKIATVGGIIGTYLLVK